MSKRLTTELNDYGSDDPHISVGAKVSILVTHCIGVAFSIDWETQRFTASHMLNVIGGEHQQVGAFFIVISMDLAEVKRLSAEEIRMWLKREIDEAKEELL